MLLQLYYVLCYFVVVSLLSIIFQTSHHRHQVTRERQAKPINQPTDHQSLTQFLLLFFLSLSSTLFIVLLFSRHTVTDFSNTMSFCRFSSDSVPVWRWQTPRMQVSWEICSLTWSRPSASCWSPKSTASSTTLPSGSAKRRASGSAPTCGITASSKVGRLRDDLWLWWTLQQWKFLFIINLKRRRRGRRADSKWSLSECE